MPYTMMNTGDDNTGYIFNEISGERIRKEEYERIQEFISNLKKGNKQDRKDAKDLQKVLDDGHNNATIWSVSNASYWREVMNGHEKHKVATREDGSTYCKDCRKILSELVII